MLPSSVLNPMVRDNGSMTVDSVSAIQTAATVRYGIRELFHPTSHVEAECYENTCIRSCRCDLAAV